MRRKINTDIVDIKAQLKAEKNNEWKLYCIIYTPARLTLWYSRARIHQKTLQPAQTKNNGCFGGVY